MTRLFNPRFLAMALFLVSVAPVYAVEDARGRLFIDGRKRSFILHAPRNATPGMLAPLVILLHGDAGSGAQMRKVSGMNEVADREGFFVAYPDGTGWAALPPYSWNAQTCCGYAQNAKVDDTSFIRQLIEHLLKQYPIDPVKIYAAGLSNGGMMAHRLACELSDRIAAIAVVAGALTVTFCSPQRPVPVLMFHGTEDHYVPYAGGQGSLESRERSDPSVETVTAFWATNNRCNPEPELARSGNVERAAYVHCAQSAEVVLYTLEGEGHAWPGGKRGWRFGQAPTQAVSASKLIGAFFAAHPLAQTETATQ